ncbi:MAG: VWA domain-containing protein [Treponema sp.]|uniref:VWA domain-containing protein n=1 Tax=Treponema sp. TaxID=166 RepID=UPI00298E3426|nr:VWA domain-containing protein [Treponema sp.]MBR5933606.1 VWA domain-containing protein [Treponema sp.]
MNFSFSRPQFLWLLITEIFLIAYLVINLKKIYKIARSFINRNNKDLAVYTPNQIYVRLLIKGICRCLAWMCLVFALAGISWGSVSVPVQKNGKACAFVFDISYSMTVPDAPDSLTRLKASSEYAKMLMDYMEGVSISCILAKGDGTIAIPQTEDFASIYSLLEVLSPSMVSSPGSSLGKGVETALRSFPSSSSKAPVIFLFTDGDETDTSLAGALNKAVRQGVSVVIIGFGAERETEITAGDGKTQVKTALRSEKLKAICRDVNSKNQSGKNFSFIKTANAKFVDASEVGSAVKVIYSLRNIPQERKQITSEDILKGFQEQEESVTVAYEMQSVDRHGMFIILAVIFFMFSLIVSEFSVKNLKLMSTAGLVVVMMTFSSCNTNFKDAKRILESTWNWYQKDYNKAISGYTETIASAEENNDEITKQYALYGLSVTYLMQNEKNASLERLEQISPDAPIKIKFASYYNAGIIAQREGEYEKAVEYFKLALLVSPDNVNAKINLELSEVQENQKAKEGQQEMTPSVEDKTNSTDIEKSIFSRMRENDQKQWKNRESSEKNSSVIDY